MSKYVERVMTVVEDDGFLKKVNEHVTIKFKKCPFCGGRAHADDAFDEEEGRARQIMKCSKCGAQTGMYDDLEGAVDAWNMRV